MTDPSHAAHALGTVQNTSISHSDCM